MRIFSRRCPALDDPNGDGDPPDGIDGWRLDVAAEVPLPFWEEFRGWVKGINPNAYLTGEIWWDDFNKAYTFHNAKPWLDRAFDGVANYPLGDAVFQFFNQPEAITATKFAGLVTDIHRDHGYERSLQLQNLFWVARHPRARSAGQSAISAGPRAGWRTIAVMTSANRRRRKSSGGADGGLQFLMPVRRMFTMAMRSVWRGADDPEIVPMIWSDLKYDDERAHPRGQPRPVDSVSVDNDSWKFYREWIGYRRELAVLRREISSGCSLRMTANCFAFRRGVWGREIPAVFNASRSPRKNSQASSV